MGLQIKESIFTAIKFQTWNYYQKFFAGHMCAPGDVNLKWPEAEERAEATRSKWNRYQFEMLIMKTYLKIRIVFLLLPFDVPWYHRTNILLLKLCACAYV